MINPEILTKDLKDLKDIKVYLMQSYCKKKCNSQTTLVLLQAMPRSAE
jgi:hypothetical protein